MAAGKRQSRGAAIHGRIVAVAFSTDDIADVFGIEGASVALHNPARALDHPAIGLRTFARGMPTSPLEYMPIWTAGRRFAPSRGWKVSVLVWRDPFAEQPDAPVRVFVRITALNRGGQSVARPLILNPPLARPRMSCGLLPGPVGQLPIQDCNLPIAAWAARAPCGSPLGADFEGGLRKSDYAAVFYLRFGVAAEPGACQLAAPWEVQA